jgi:hypothetical protein
MRQQLRASALAVAVLASVGFAVAQTSPSSTAAPSGQLNLTPSQQQILSQRLGNEQAQQVPTGYRPQVGSTLPDALQTRSLPPEIVQQIPDLQTFHYTLIPGYMIVVDPRNHMVMELIRVPATTARARRKSDVSFGSDSRHCSMRSTSQTSAVS